MNKREIFRGITNYLMSVALALIFALYLSGRVGWFLMAAFLTAPIISLVLTALFRSRIYLSIEGGAMTVSKGDSAELDIIISNGFFLPSPPLQLEIFDSDGAKAECSKYTCYVMPMTEEPVTASYHARICGPHAIGVKSIVIRDYFGIFTFKLKNIDMDELRTDLNIMPEIADIPFTSRIFRQASELSAMADDSEDTVSSTNVTFGGFPGYDSREYVPGDPLKRINWKQSAKKGTLLVRLDDEATASSISVVLDGVYEEATDPKLFHSSDKLLGNSLDELKELAGQWAMENSLGMVRAFVRHNYSVTYFYMGNDGWQSANIADENELTQIQTNLAASSYMKQAKFPRFPSDEISGLKGSVSVFFTPYCSNELYAQLSEYMGSKGKGEISSVLCAAVTDTAAALDMEETG